MKKSRTWIPKREGIGVARPHLDVLSTVSAFVSAVLFLLPLAVPAFLNSLNGLWVVAAALVLVAVGAGVVSPSRGGRGHVLAVIGIVLGALTAAGLMFLSLVGLFLSIALTGEIGSFKDLFATG